MAILRVLEQSPESRLFARPPRVTKVTMERRTRDGWIFSELCADEGGDLVVRHRGSVVARQRGKASHRVAQDLSCATLIQHIGGALTDQEFGDPCVDALHGA